jgi:hypothetical protein
MRLLVFFVVGLLLMLTAYAFALGGTVAVLILLFVLVNGIIDRWAQPMLQWLRS